MNKAILIGNLTRDPEMRRTQDGTSVCNFTLAVNRPKRDGEAEADFFRVTAWRALGENCCKYLAKGRKCAVTGEITLEHYTDAEGLIRYQMAVTADSVEFLTPKEQSAG